MGSMKLTTTAICLALLIGIMCPGSPCLAEESQSPSSEQRLSATTALDEIVVTAEKREQNIQEVPSAITAFTAEGLAERGIVTPQDLQQSVPGLSIGELTNLGGVARTTLRGVGSENFGPGGDPGVPIHINGHYTQSSAYIFRDMIDVERVEIQRGPQGTLYGRNAIGGNINLVTNRPTDEFEGSFGLDIGNYDRLMGQIIVSGPLSDSVRGRFVVASAGQDGFVEELGVGDDRDSVDYTSIRGALEIDLSEDVELYINAYHFDDTGNTYTRRIDMDPNNLANSEPFKTRSNTPDESDDNSKGLSFDISWNMDGMVFRSLTAYDDTYKTARQEIDGNHIRVSEFGVDIDMRIWTQEFQLISANGGPLQWVTGVFYYNEDSSEVRHTILDRFDTDNDGLTGLDYDLDQPLVHQFGQTENTAESWAVFGQLDYDLTERFQLVAGLRYTRDEKSYFSGADTVLSDGSSRTVPIGGGRTIDFPILDMVFFDNREGTDWSEVTGKLGLTFRASDDVMFYGSFSRGYKAGGYSAKQDEFYDPEAVDAWEAGMKARWLDSRVQTNLALFYYDYKDKQELQFFPPNAQFPNGGIKLINAAGATSSGVELEFQGHLTDRFLVDGFVAYLDAEYDDFHTIDALFPALGFQDLSGNKLPLSPEMKYNIGAQYDWALGAQSGSLSARLDYSWTDDQWGNALNRDGTNLPATGDQIPSYEILNASLQWISSSGALEVSLFARNVTDETAISNSFVARANEVLQSNVDPRTYGVRVNYFFNRR